LEYKPVPEGEADKARRLALSIVEILLRERNDSGDSDYLAHKESQ